MTVYEQLSEYCDCQEVNEKDVKELIDLISLYTRWTTAPCETFLEEERKEVVDLPDCVNDCDVYTFEPKYKPFDPETFTFTLVEQEGIKETHTVLTEWFYSEGDENFKMELPLPKCGCHPVCGCEVDYKLVVEYVAGYEEIPDCLLPVFCEALQWIRDKNLCDCSECQTCDTNEEVKEIDISTLTGRLQDYFLEVLTQQYARQLSLIAICDKETGLWGVVV